MAVQMRDLIRSALPELRVHPVAKWVRATAGDVLVVSSTSARLVWEPQRVVASYAVPREDVAAELLPDTPVDAAAQEHPVSLGEDGPAVLDPRTPFTVHTCPGTSLTLRTAQGDLPGAGFAPVDGDLAGYVILDWKAFTQWYEEDEPVIGPRDPFRRIDCLRSSRRVTISADGQALAESSRATWLFEAALPARYYLPRDDVAMDLLEPSPLHTVCAYKGRATYWSARVGDRVLPDVAWTYEQPLHDAAPVEGLVAFFTERLDLAVDGVALPRPQTPWSRLPPA